jgi:hypothetical protein
MCHPEGMAKKQTKQKSTEWNVGQPLTFPVLRPRIQQAANQAVDEAIRGSFNGTRPKRKKK